tara:strand:+ start:108376 stop:108507 length:132 start_codon:yes stop_codon:yes gene_type:complete
LTSSAITWVEIIPAATSAALRGSNFIVSPVVPFVIWSSTRSRL